MEHLPLALIFLGEFFVFAIEAEIVVRLLLTVRGNTINFTLSVVHDGRWRAPQWHLTDGPIRIVVEVGGENGNLQFVVVIEVDESIRTVDIVERCEALHCRLSVEAMRSKFTVGCKKHQIRFVAGQNDPTVSGNILCENTFRISLYDKLRVAGRRLTKMTNGSNAICLVAVNIAIFVDFHSMDGLMKRQHNVMSQFTESNFQMTARVAKYL